MPPSFDGCRRSPLPRFTVLTGTERERLHNFFGNLADRLMRVLVPGAHVFIATNLLSYLVYEPFIRAGFEKRGEIIRLVQTLRGGDSSEERGEGVRDGVCHATVLLGTVGALSKAP